MKKIVYVVESLEKGVGKHIQDLCLCLNMSKDEEFELFVFYGEKRADTEILAKFNSENLIPIKNLKREIGLNDIKAIFEIRKHLKIIKPDIVHCHSSKAGLSGRISAKISGVKKIIYSPHAYFFLKFDVKSFKRKLFIFAEKILSRFFTNVTITTSKGEDEDYLKYKIDNNAKRVLIEHGLEIMEISTKERKDLRHQIGVNDEHILIGGMARLEEQKDPITMINIMQKLIERNKKVKCIIWGNGSLFEKMKEINEKSKDKVFLAGETLEPDKCLSMLDIYLTTSLYEGLPYTLLESLGLGLPIVATNVEGNKDCVCDGKNGVLFEVKDYDGAVSKIENIIIENKCEQMRKESLKIFKERFSMEKMIEKYRSLYIDE